MRSTRGGEDTAVDVVGHSEFEIVVFKVDDSDIVQNLDHELAWTISLDSFHCAE